MKFIFVAALLLTTVVSQLSFGADRMCLPSNSDQISRGGPGTWPWGMEIPFPWKGIQGIWMTNIGGCTTYYTFTTVKNATDEKILQIHEVDPVTCSIISKGAGYEDDRIVMAVMNGKGGVYNLEVHSFRESDVIEANSYSSIQGSNKVLTMMTISSMVTPSSKGTYQLYKVSNDPDGACKH